jgi:hypothetical protein
LALANLAPPLGESEGGSAEIAANRRASASFEALVPEMEAICGGGLIFRTRPLNDESPLQSGLSREAAEGIRTLDLLHGNYTGHLASAVSELVDLQEISARPGKHSSPSMCADMH